MSALIFAAVRDLLSWELDHHSGCDEAGAALHEAIKRVESYGRDDLLSRLLCAVIATSRDDRQRADAAAVLALLDKARRADAEAESNGTLRRPLPPEGETRRREAAGE